MLFIVIKKPTFATVFALSGGVCVYTTTTTTITIVDICDYFLMLIVNYRSSLS